MSATKESKIAISVPNTTIQQICNCVAIAETKSPDESLRELILHTLLTFADERASSVQEVADILKTIFGVKASNHQVQGALDHLISAGQVRRPMGTNYVLTYDARSKISERIDQASKLQERVRNQWVGEIVKQFPGLNADLAWDALLDYLAKAFLRHGIQVALFLDPSVELPKEYAVSLTTLLASTVRSRFESNHQESAKLAISNFLANVGMYPDRAQFIIECADGAANYFSLSVSPEVAKCFREKLSPLSLFCDTNFLFGILDLHVHPLVEISNELLELIAKHTLPIKLLYHSATLRELLSSISYYGDILRRHSWPQGLSRAAITSHFISGIELKYHQKNAETGIEVEDFLRLYQHADVLLEGHNISIFHPQSDRLNERADLEAEYKEFLERLHKEKPQGLIAHDVAVLDCVRSLRHNVQSTLEAGAILVTCDYMLYRFDSEASRNAKTPASVVLPNVLWQILRPFIPASQDFDRTFAETFAIPEFRTIGSGSSKACSKMLALLTTYKDFPEETAIKLLSNELLIDNLRTAANEEQFQAQVESAIIAENQALLEERAALAKKIDALQSEKERTEKELEKQRQATTEMEAAKVAAERAIVKETERMREREVRDLRIAKINSIIFAIFLIIIFEISIHKFWRWDWILNHPNSYGLQGCISLMLLFGILGLWVKPWRKILWFIGFFGVLFVALQILGGPTNTP